MSIVSLSYQIIDGQGGKTAEEGARMDEQVAPKVVAQAFDPREMDKIIRQIVDKERGNYFLNGETGRGIPAEVKKIIESSIDRI